MLYEAGILPQPDTSRGLRTCIRLPVGQGHGIGGMEVHWQVRINELTFTGGPQDVVEADPCCL